MSQPAAQALGNAVTLHHYKSEKPDEMALNIGEVVRVLKKADDGWWFGHKIQPQSDHHGWFPSNFCFEATAFDVGRPGPLRYAKVMYVYAAQEEDELNLRVGDVVAVLNSDEEDGWYRGVLNGRCGLFPANFVSMISKGDVEKAGSGNATTAKASKPADRLSSLYVENTKPAQQARPGGNDKFELVIATHEYVAQNPDELNLKKGMKIKVIGKEDDGWWLGVDEFGREGVFPYNFVKVLAKSDPRGSQPAAAQNTQTPNAFLRKSQHAGANGPNTKPAVSTANSDAPSQKSKPTQGSQATYDSDKTLAKTMNSSPNNASIETNKKSATKASAAEEKGIFKSISKSPEQPLQESNTSNLPPLTAPKPTSKPPIGGVKLPMPVFGKNANKDLPVMRHMNSGDSLEPSSPTANAKPVQVLPLAGDSLPPPLTVIPTTSPQPLKIPDNASSLDVATMTAQSKPKLTHPNKKRVSTAEKRLPTKYANTSNEDMARNFVDEAVLMQPESKYNPNPVVVVGASDSPLISNTATSPKPVLSSPPKKPLPRHEYQNEDTIIEESRISNPMPLKNPPENKVPTGGYTAKGDSDGTTERTLFKNKDADLPPAIADDRALKKSQQDLSLPHPPDSNPSYRRPSIGKLQAQPLSLDKGENSSSQTTIAPTTSAPSSPMRTHAPDHAPNGLASLKPGSSNTISVPVNMSMPMPPSSNTSSAPTSPPAAAAHMSPPHSVVSNTSYNSSTSQPVSISVSGPPSGLKSIEEVIQWTQKEIASLKSYFEDQLRSERTMRAEMHLEIMELRKLVEKGGSHR